MISLLSRDIVFVGREEPALTPNFESNKRRHQALVIYSSHVELVKITKPRSEATDFLCMRIDASSGLPDMYALA